MGLVPIGRIVRAVGLKGHVGIAGTEGALGKLSRIALRRGRDDAGIWNIEEARPQGKVWAVKLERLEHWLKVGAKPSPSVAMILKRARPQQPAEK